MNIEARDNREHILEQALLLFTEHGYDAVGVQAICEAAGVSKPTLYHYFGSKRGVLEALVGRYTQTLLQDLEQPLQYTGDLRHNLEFTVERLVQAAKSHPNAVQLFLTVQHAPRSSDSRRAATTFFGELRRQLRELFRAAAEDHGNMRGREEAYAVSFQASVFGYIELLLEGQITEEEQLPHQIMNQFAHGIFS